MRGAEGGGITIATKGDIAKGGLDVIEELEGRHWTWQLTIDATLAHGTNVGETKQIGQTMIHAPYGLVEIGVRGIETNAVTDGVPQDAADVVALRIDTLGATEEQWMVADYELATPLMGLLNHSLGDIQTGKNATDLLVRIAALEASIIIRFL